MAAVTTWWIWLVCIVVAMALCVRVSARGSGNGVGSRRAMRCEAMNQSIFELPSTFWQVSTDGVRSWTPGTLMRNGATTVGVLVKVAPDDEVHRVCPEFCKDVEEYAQGSGTFFKVITCGEVD